MTYAWGLREHVAAGPFADILAGTLASGRALDRGNPSPDNILRDFRRICPQLWRDLEHRDRRSLAWRRKLELLNAWRNAIAHHDFTRLATSDHRLPLSTVRAWRRACGGLATSLDAVVAASLRRLVGRSPW